ncbi:MAG: DegT/DnrJ/EryC1/StrS family aminotransferase [Elusimicrobia bacterium]|nr:DegT/DnrJ/EryC1/StrS family aminotransferase [Elusimicrobiota bacterium]
MYIPTSKPYLDKGELDNVVSAMNDGAISGLFGKYIDEFENKFARYCDCKYGISTNSGTTALHVAVASLGIGKGDEVIVASLTNMATFFAVLYQYAKPVPVDIEKDTMNIDPGLIESKINKNTKAIMVVHLFGHPVDMDPIIKLAKKYKLYIIEDCAEAHGALYKGRKVGSLGDIGCFSFYSNKIVTTGEGGMITTNNAEIAAKSRSLKCLAFGTKNKFMHKSIGYGYRMTNIQAAIGCAQLKKVEVIIDKKRKIAKYYNEQFKNISELAIPVEKEYAKNVYWMYHVVLGRDVKLSRERVMNKLKEYGIETRESFIPYNMQEIFIRKGWVNHNECPNANYVAGKGFYIPSGPILSKKELEYVSGKIKKVLLNK